MERVGYSTSRIGGVRQEIGWLFSNHDSFDTYEKALDLRAPKGEDSSTRRAHGSRMGICRHSDLDARSAEATSIAELAPMRRRRRANVDCQR